MRAALQRIRPFLPVRFWRSLSDALWDRFWHSELHRTLKQAPFLPAKPLRGSERAMLIEAVAESHPFSRVLEIGCAYGQTLHSLAPMFPQARFVGVDRDGKSVSEGSLTLREHGIRNAELLTIDASDLSKFSDSEFDVSYCIACLLYISDEKIEIVLREMARVTTKNMVMLEQHREGAGSERVERRGGDYWLRDYRAILEKVVPNGRITITPVRNSLWEAEQWAKYGALIDVRLK